MRLLNPADRKKRPADSDVFFHYMTEHGVMPAECGVNDAAGAWELKSKCALRSYCLWLNKGVHAMHYYCARSEKDVEFGLLPVDVEKLPKNAKFEDVATPPMKAIRNLVRCFEGSGSAEAPSAPQLNVDASETGDARTIFTGDAKHPPLYERDLLAVLPFRVSARQLAIPVYVVSYDITKKSPDRTYRLTLSNLGGAAKEIYCADPVTAKPVEIKILRRENETIDIELPVNDCPRVLTIKF